MLTICVVLVYAAYTVTLRPTSFLSGWLLFVLMLALASYNIRKKLPFLPLGTSAGWLQFHIYAGLLTVVLFVLHSGLHVPNGALEVTLALLYVAVAGSGIMGLALSRLLARRLAIHGEEVIFERIPAMRKHLRERAEELVEQSASETSSIVLADFYVSRLAPFFDGPGNFWDHLFESDRPRHTLLAALGALDRYLSAKEREYVREMGSLIRVKDNLDYHDALQGTLKYWLFIHIPMTYSLLILSLVHAVLASAYGAGIR